MATPITAGAATLLRQYLREVRAVANPSAALLKALLINGATVPVTESNVPNSDRGFGWLNLANTLAPEPTGEQIFIDDIGRSVAQGETRRFSVSVADTSHPFRCTLVWTDLPGDQLQNQLYLRVVAPDGTEFDGDVTPIDNPTNNTQRVHIESPETGEYRIEIHGVAVTFSVAPTGELRQDFALAVINGTQLTVKEEVVVQIVPVTELLENENLLVWLQTSTDQLIAALNGAPGVHVAAGNSMNSIGSTVSSVVVLSDGRQNEAAFSALSKTNGSAENAANMQIHALSLGSDINDGSLQRRALESGGSYSVLEDPQDVAELCEATLQVQAMASGTEVIDSGHGSVWMLPCEGDTLPPLASVDEIDEDGALVADLAGLVVSTVQIPCRPAASRCGRQ